MDIVMPQLGETVREGTVTQWLKKPGDKVKRDELLFVVGTDKVEMEIPAPADGTLVEILVADGKTVDVGTRLAVLDDGTGLIAPTVKPATATSSIASATAPAMAPQGDDKRLSPVVRRLLAEHDLTAEGIAGTGEGGRITRDDVLRYIEGRHIDGKSAPKPGSPAILETIPFSYRRKMIAEHMSRSLATSAHVVQAMEVDFGALEPVRKKSKLTFLPFIARALCAAIQAFPRVNATIDGNNLLVYRDINLAIAVDLDHEGLMTPVIKGADKLSVPDLARAIYDLATRARAGKLNPDEMAGATYTISNSGSYGTLFTASIINQPQVAILSTDGVKKKPVVVEADGKEEIAIRPIGVLAQSFDHRAFDGAYSAAFLKRLKDEIETRDWAREIE